LYLHNFSFPGNWHDFGLLTFNKNVNHKPATRPHLPSLRSISEGTIHMASITKLKTNQSVQHFDHGAAFNLVQAFHRHLDLGDLLQAFFAQAHTLLECVGMRYRNTHDEIDLQLGEDGPHSTSYKLTYQELNLGELVFLFRRRVTEDTLATAEDLTSLIMSPINNALLYRRLQQQPSAGQNATRAQPAIQHKPGQPSRPEPKRAGAVKAGKDDTLVLIGLDGFATIRDRDGLEWAQALVHAMQDQIREGLREADGVFQIDDEMLAVLLPRTSGNAALEVAKKIRVLIAGLHLRDGSITTQLTACMGIAGTNDANNAEQVLQQARAALQIAQREGSNRIELFLGGA
jgi:diguanylate cyclase (GGDEF)-like protein